MISGTYTVAVSPHPSALPAGTGTTGTLTGKSCFDIVYSNNNVNGCTSLTSRASQKTDFSLTAVQDPSLGAVTRPYTGTQVYAFKVSGSGVSNVRFIAMDTDGDIVESVTPQANYSGTVSNGTTCKVTVVYKSSLNTSLRGLTAATAKQMKLYAVYTLSGTDRAVELNIRLQDCSCCGAMTTSGTWLAFMCHNLGVEESLDPFTHVEGLYGDLYQWGRKMDGHEKRYSGTTTTRVDSDDVGHGNFIVGAVDWRYPSSPTLWGITKTANDPCPVGWKVPTSSHWQSIFNTNTDEIQSPSAATANTWTWTGNGYMIGQSLYLPAAGYRNRSNGSLIEIGTRGMYWSSGASTGSVSHSLNIYVSNTTYFVNTSSSSERGYGLSVRCVQE